MFTVLTPKVYFSGNASIYSSLIIIWRFLEVLSKNSKKLEDFKKNPQA